MDIIRVCLKYAGYSTADKQSNEYAKIYETYLRISTLWGKFEEYPRIFEVSCLKRTAYLSFTLQAFILSIQNGLVSIGRVPQILCEGVQIPIRCAEPQRNMLLSILS